MNDFYLKNIEGRGRGLFSSREFKKGEVVERSPVIIFKHRETTDQNQQLVDVNGQKTLVKTVTHHGKLPQEISNIIFHWAAPGYNHGELCIALGYGSLFNSENPSNMRYDIDRATNDLVFTAAVDIPVNVELTVNYSGVYGNNISVDNNWFQKRNITFKK